MHPLGRYYNKLYHLSYQGNPKSSLVAQAVKNLPAMQEAGVQSLGWEDPLEKEMATHSSILGWRISWIEEPGGLQSMGSQRVGHNQATKPSDQFSSVQVFSCIIHM